MARIFRHIILFLMIISTFFAAAQGTQKKKETLYYIDKYKDAAMTEMVKYKIPASITLAQGILESGNGQSKLAKQGNNHFGIKCHNDWKGKTMRVDDDAPKECFRMYKNADESYRDHSIFLKNSQRYASLFELKITDYKGWAKGLKKAGYATLPTYATVLINLIETYNLQQYDEMVVKGKFKKSKKEKEVKKEEPKEQKKTTPKKKKSSSNRYDVPVLAECTVVGVTDDHHYIRENFGVKFVFAKAGDNLASLAKELGTSQRQLRKYNNFDKNKTFKEGEVVYVTPKRHSAPSGYRYHEIQQGETLRKVSELYAVRLERLFKMNGLDENSIIQVGQEIKLR